jgi:predicted aminopeptidase
VLDVRKFGIEELGLKDTKNYTTLVEIEGDRVATVVQACAELSFDRYLWNYPVVGRLPYKGFFEPEGANREAARLKAEGWDVIVRGVDSFSTLGWFSDPLFSFMESYGEADLAELVLHEMTHATAFSKREGPFNEELATFVGRKGAEAYLARKGAAAALAAYRSARSEEAAFAAFVAETAAELDAVYRSAADPAEKRLEKARVIAVRAEAYRATLAPSFSSEGRREFPMGKINNAFIDLYALYEGEPRLYEDYLAAACGGDLRLFIERAAAAAKGRGDPKEALKAALSVPHAKTLEVAPKLAIIGEEGLRNAPEE